VATIYRHRVTMIGNVVGSNHCGERPMSLKALDVISNRGDVVVRIVPRSRQNMPH